MISKDGCDVVPIGNLHSSITQKVNILGVILEYAFPKTTRGTDYCCTLRIVDESYHMTGMAVNVFAESPEKLPLVVRAGDLVQLCRCKVQSHGGEVNVVYNKSFSAFALYEGKDLDDYVPYQVSSKFEPGSNDRMFIDKLRKWLVNFQPNDDRSDFPLFREIKVGEHINLTCKILHCYEAAKNQWYVFVWDGTDTPPNPICANLEDEVKSPLPLQLESPSLPRELLCTFPTIGSVLRITFDRCIVKDYLYLLNNMKWVKFVNMRLEVYAGLWRVVFSPYSKIRYTPDEDDFVLERQRLYDERVSLKSGKHFVVSFPVPSSVTVLPDKYDHVPYVTLMDVLTHSVAIAKFKCVVRVVAAMPCQARLVRSPSGIYRLRLTLEDPTARIHALVFAEDGETLFDGYPSTDILETKLNKLFGETTEGDDCRGSPSRNPPWVSVCLKSYFVSDADVWGSRHFRIFDTKIMGDAMGE